MPVNLDQLYERLKHYDELELLDLLRITSDDIIKRFGDRIRDRREYLCAELELINIDDPELEDFNEELDGFQIEEVGDDE